MNDRKQHPIFSPMIDRADGQLLRRRWVWLVYVLLFGAAIPWYLPAGRAPQIWFGLPHWVVISLLATIGIAGFTAFVVHRYWSDDDISDSTSGEDHQA